MDLAPIAPPAGFTFNQFLAVGALRPLSALAPRTLALVHGPSFSGDGAAALRALGDEYNRRVAKSFAGSKP